MQTRFELDGRLAKAVVLVMVLVSGVVYFEFPARAGDEIPPTS